LFSLAIAVAPTDPGRAVQLLDESIVAAEAAANDWAVANSAAARGSVLASWGDHAAAARVLLEGVQNHELAGNRSSMAQNVATLCFIFAGVGRPDVAATLEGWARTIVSEGSIASELLLGGWTEDVVDAVGSLPEVLGEEGYQRLKTRGAALSDDEVIAYVSEAVELLERAQA